MTANAKEESAREAPETFARQLNQTPVKRAIVPFQNKRGARIEYYQRIRQAMLEHAQTTEEKIRNLEGLKPGKAEELAADLHKTHEKLLERIDNRIRRERTHTS